MAGDPPTRIKLTYEDYREIPNDGKRHEIIAVLNEDRDILAPSHIVGPPDLVVEILSPSSIRLDRHIKRECSEKFGIPEYWIADPDAREVARHGLEGDRYALTGPYAERIESGTMRGVVIDLTKVW